MTATNGLPRPSENQPFMNVSALEAGLIGLPRHMYVAGADPSITDMCPSMAFFLQHSTNARNLVFDLGLGKDLSKYSPGAHDLIKASHPVMVTQDAAESLLKGGCRPEDVQDIVLSHLHFDHVGDASLFPASRFILHEDVKALLSSDPTNPIVKLSSCDIPEHQRHFFGNPDLNCSIGPFPRAMDYYQDGSLYLIDSPGHLPGHVNILARTSPTGSWIYLGGDSAHNICLITGHCGIAEYVNEETGKVQSAHVDLETAKLHLERVTRLRENPSVQVLLAHDKAWYEENKGGAAFFPGKIPPQEEHSI